MGWLRLSRGRAAQSRAGEGPCQPRWAEGRATPRKWPASSRQRHGSDDRSDHRATCRHVYQTTCAVIQPRVACLLDRGHQQRRGSPAQVWSLGPLAMRQPSRPEAAPPFSRDDVYHYPQSYDDLLVVTYNPVIHLYSEDTTFFQTRRPTHHSCLACHPSSPTYFHACPSALIVHANFCRPAIPSASKSWTTYKCDRRARCDSRNSGMRSPRSY